MNMTKTFFRSMIRLAFWSLLSFVANRAQAGVFLEPYAGLGIDSFKSDLSSGGTLKYTGSGANVGARVGVALPVFYIDAAYQYDTLSTSVDEPAGSGFQTGPATHWGVLGEIGAKLPMVRVFAGYGFINNWNFKGATGTTDLKFMGNSYNFGLSFTGIRFIAINFELQLANFSKYNAGGSDTATDGSGTFKNASAITYIVSLSIPLGR